MRAVVVFSLLAVTGAYAVDADARAALEGPDAADAGADPSTDVGDVADAEETMGEELAALVALLADPEVALEVKREALDGFAGVRLADGGVVSVLDPSAPALSVSGISDLLEHARPDEHRHALCVAARRVVPTRFVRIEVLDSWGDPVASALMMGEAQDAVLPWRGEVPECLPWVVVRYQGGADAVLRVPPPTPNVPRLTYVVPGPSPLLIVSGVLQGSWVTPGWRDGAQFHASAGARVDSWGRWHHASLALKASTFSTYIYGPVVIAVDAFAGVGHAFELQPFDVRAALDVGVWSTFCPTLRPTIALGKGPYFAAADFNFHLYPMLLVPPGQRERRYRDVPFDNFVFWSVGASMGVAW